MGKKSSWRRRNQKAISYGIIYIAPTPEPEKQPEQPKGSACGKCLSCSAFRRQECAGLATYWQPWCAKAKCSSRVWAGGREWT